MIRHTCPYRYITQTLPPHSRRAVHATQKYDHVSQAEPNLATKMKFSQHEFPTACLEINIKYIVSIGLSGIDITFQTSHDGSSERPLYSYTTHQNNVSLKFPKNEVHFSNISELRSHRK
jgi:hypothetical protein